MKIRDINKIIIFSLPLRPFAVSRNNFIFFCARASTDFRGAFSKLILEGRKRANAKSMAISFLLIKKPIMMKNETRAGSNRRCTTIKREMCYRRGKRNKTVVEKLAGRYGTINIQKEKFKKLVLIC